MDQYRLAYSFACRLCDKYQNLILVSRPDITEKIVYWDVKDQIKQIILVYGKKVPKFQTLFTFWSQVKMLFLGLEYTKLSE